MKMSISNTKEMSGIDTKSDNHNDSIKINRNCKICQEKEDKKIFREEKYSNGTTKEDGAEEREKRKKIKDLTINRMPVSSNYNLETPSKFEEGMNTCTGKSIDYSTREFMESRFGYDFSNVRIHNDARD